MAGLKNRLGKYLRDKLGITALQHRVSSQLNFQMAFLNFTSPEVLKIPEELLVSIQKDLQLRYGVTEFVPAIHKNDVMFQHHLYHSPDIAEALKHYFVVGARLSIAISEHMSVSSKEEILDFGAGYGRLTRFLSEFYPKNNLVASEVKPGAVKFLDAHLGVPGFSHAIKPELFPQRMFGGIVAISVFTHLPQELFESWLKSLAGSLTREGVIFLTYNDIDRSKQSAGKDFFYTTQSEDSFFITTDRLDQGEEYGLTFISRNYLEKIAKLCQLSVDFIDSEAFGSQSVALLHKV